MCIFLAGLCLRLSQNPPFCMHIKVYLFQTFVTEMLTSDLIYPEWMIYETLYLLLNNRLFFFQWDLKKKKILDRFSYIATDSPEAIDIPFE